MVLAPLVGHTTEFQPLPRTQNRVFACKLTKRLDCGLPWIHGTLNLTTDRESGRHTVWKLTRWICLLAGKSRQRPSRSGCVANRAFQGGQPSQQRGDPISAECSQSQVLFSRADLCFVERAEQSLGLRCPPRHPSACSAENLVTYKYCAQQHC